LKPPLVIKILGMRETCEIEKVVDGKTHKHGAKTLQ
jgi:hypothetical protein